jgi:predicted dehydrogenase
VSAEEPIRVLVAGLGVQGEKRRHVAGDDVVATVDPTVERADYRYVEDVPLDRYDAALVCTPDSAKIAVLTHLLGNGKHVLVEKPLFAKTDSELEHIETLARQHKAVCYTAYNHRFEPHFARMREVIEAGVLGEIYAIRLFYGNGTARLVRESEWRDKGAGVLPDLGSHLLDTLLFWTGEAREDFAIQSARRFENRALDHVTFMAGKGKPLLQCEATLLMWRNHFTADVLAENGSAHITSLCKWGPTEFTLRKRQLPSGRPDEEAITLVEPDPTWRSEYRHFKTLIAEGASPGNREADLWINRTLRGLSEQAQESA